MDVVSIMSAYQGVKAAKDLLTAAFDAKVDSDAKHKILEAQSKLGEIQDTLFLLRDQLAQMQDENRQLQDQLRASESWSDRVKQYELVKSAGGAVVYRFGGSPEHFACPTCINKKEIQILQDSRALSGKYRCTGCTNEFPVQPRQDPNVVVQPMHSSWGRS